MKAVLTKRIVDMFKSYLKNITRSNFNKVFIKNKTAVMTNGKTLFYINLPNGEAHFELENEQNAKDGVIRYETLKGVKNGNYVNQIVKFDLDEEHDFPIDGANDIWNGNQKYYNNAITLHFDIKNLENTVNIFKKLKIESIKFDIPHESVKPIRITGKKKDKEIVNGLLMPLRWS